MEFRTPSGGSTSGAVDEPTNAQRAAEPAAPAALPELIYFDGPGRGELSRLALKAGRIAFKDTRVQMGPEWLAMKADSTSAPGSMFGSMPVLVKDGAMIAQSFAVAQFVTELGLQTTRTPEQRALDTMMCGTWADLQKAMYACMFGSEEDKKKNLEELSDKVKPLLEGTERQYARGKGPFLCGDVMSLGDLAVFDAVASARPGLRAFGINVGPYPRVSDCVAACQLAVYQVSGPPPPPGVAPKASGTPQLIYFDAAGRGEIARLAFHAGNVRFTDTRVGFEEWPAMKADPESVPSKLFGTMPVIDHGGFLVAQSSAVAQYAADLGINRSNRSLTALQRNLDAMLLSVLADIQGATLPIVFGGEEAKAAARGALLGKVTPLLLGIERQYARGMPPFLYSPKAIGPTLGDLAVFAAVALPGIGLSACGVDMEPYPLIRQCIAECRQAPGRPGLKAYLGQCGY